MNPGVVIELDRTRHVKFTFSELKTLQQRLGKPLGEIFGDLTKLDVAALQVVLWVGLRADDKALRFERVEELIQDYIDGGHSVGDVLYVVNEAVVASGFFGAEAKREKGSSPS